MITLSSTSDILQLVTATGVTQINVHASWVDLLSGTYTPGRTNSAITTATTTNIVSAPAASTQRMVRSVKVENSSASSCVVTLQHTDGTTSVKLCVCTLLSDETMTIDENGHIEHRTKNGAIYSASNLNMYIPSLGISGTLAETYPRMLGEENTNPLTSGTLALIAVYMPENLLVTNISFFSATTAASSPTNGFFALYDDKYFRVAQTANFTTEAWAANTIKTKALTSPYRTTRRGWYYFGIMITATTVPTLKTIGLKTNQQLSFSPTALCGNSTTGLTTSLPIQALAISSASTTGHIWAVAT